MSKKPALGKGLSALLDHVDTEVIIPEKKKKKKLKEPAVDTISSLPLEQIEINPFQPRTEFDEVAIMELAGSIRQHGIIQPLTVRKIGTGRYQLISGERRFRASRRAGLKAVPCYIREADDQAVLEMALVENIQREDLNPIEVGISYQRLIEECDLTQEQLSMKVGKKRTTITNYLRLLRLPAEIQTGLMMKKLSMGHARALVNIESEKKQLALYNRILEEGLSVRAVERAVQDLSDAKPREQRSKRPMTFEQERFRDGLRRMLGTTVRLKVDAKGKGSIVIPFENDEDLRRIAHALDF